MIKDSRLNHQKAPVKTTQSPNHRILLVMAMCNRTILDFGF